MAESGKAVRYECTRCGACCRWAGDVCIEEDEVREISVSSTWTSRPSLTNAAA